MSTTPNLRTPLGRVRGLGSAKSGTGHFWHQRLTAIANVPLTIGFVIILVSVLGRGHALVQQTLGSPLVAITMLLFVCSITYHMKLGMQVIIEDYVHDEKWKLAAIIANLFFAIAVAAICIYSLLKLSFGV
jgi:succinate dehydrogenase / fumarate reductase, membrane anchor subunit